MKKIQTRGLRLLLTLALALILWNASAAILERLQKGEDLTIAAIGTSLTDKGFNKDTGWFEQTGAWLNGLSFPGKVTLANRAVCGSASRTDPTTTGSKDGFHQLNEVLEHDNPDVIFIEFAINDAYLPYHISQKQSQENLQTMIRQIRDWADRQNQGKGKTVDIVVQTMNNCIGHEAEKRPNLAQYYLGYEEVANANPGVLFIDHYSLWLGLYHSREDDAPWTSWVPDTIHPNARGAKEVIVPRIQKALYAQVEAIGEPARLKELEGCNVVWDNPSTNSSGSMPLGNGDIGLNVWVEENGDLLFFISKTDAFTDSGRLVKLGQVRVRLTPSLAARPFRQELQLEKGQIAIESGEGVAKITLRVWVDAHNPVIHVEGDSQKEFQAEVGLNVWRTADRDWKGDGNTGYISETPDSLLEKADTVLSQKENRIVWYHHNERTIVPLTLKHQGMESLSPLVHDPILQRTFGGCIHGSGLVATPVEGATQGLRTKTPGRHLDVAIDVLSTQFSKVEGWLKFLDNMMEVEKNEAKRSDPWKAHCQWWSQFWNRSWIYVHTPDETAPASTEQIAARLWDRQNLQLLGTNGLHESNHVIPAVNSGPSGPILNQGYALQRFITACAGRGFYPIKEDGSIFRVNGKNHDRLADADLRQQGPNYWFLDTATTACGPMLRSGDFEMLQPLFDMYRGMVPMARERTHLMFHHEGIFIPATVYPWGTYQENDWVRWLWQGGIELSSKMLDYYEATGNEYFFKDTLMPIADGVMTFFDQHWKRDEKGKIRMEPACALESCHHVVNPLPEIAGLHYVLPRLLALPSEKITPTQRATWTRLLADLPEVPMSGKPGEKIFVAAEVIKDRQGDELPELYAVFPYRLHALGCPDFETGLRSVEHYVPEQPRTVYPFEGKAGGWRLNPIQVAYVGKSEQAARMVTSNFASHDPGSRFPAFWGPNQVGLPDQSHGGVSMTALQAMLLQVDGRKIYLFPAWPKKWDVQFKLHALFNTTVEGELHEGKVTSLKVSPPSRAADVINLLQK